jgi:glycolate oxidase
MDSARIDGAFATRLVEICGADGVVTDPQQLRTYECDGLTAHRCSPGLVVLPSTAEQVAAANAF